MMRGSCSTSTVMLGGVDMAIGFVVNSLLGGCWGREGSIKGNGNKGKCDNDCGFSPVGERWGIVLLGSGVLFFNPPLGVGLY